MRRTVPINIDRLIENINEKLPTRVIGYEKKPELCLWNISVINRWHPITDKGKHLRKMRLAWLAQGKVGLLNYIEPYVNKSRLHRVRAILLSIQ